MSWKLDYPHSGNLAAGLYIKYEEKNIVSKYLQCLNFFFDNFINGEKFKTFIISVWVILLWNFIIYESIGAKKPLTPLQYYNVLIIVIIIIVIRRAQQSPLKPTTTIAHSLQRCLVNIVYASRTCKRTKLLFLWAPATNKLHILN